MGIIDYGRANVLRRGVGGSPSGAPLGRDGAAKVLAHLLDSDYSDTAATFWLMGWRDATGADEAEVEMLVHEAVGVAEDVAFELAAARGQVAA